MSFYQIGHRKGKWLVIGIEERWPTQYICRCDCGLEKKMTKPVLIRNKRKMCPDCWYKLNDTERAIVINDKA